MANTRNYQNQGGSTWVVSGALNVVSSGNINISSGGLIDQPVTGSTSADAPIPNYGLCIVRGGAVADDVRLVAGPTRAGLELNLVANSSTTIGINVCVASVSSNVDIVIRSTGNQESVWEIIGSTQNCKLISANTSEWYVIGPITGTLSTDGST